MGALAVPLLIIGGSAAASSIQKNAVADAQDRTFEANRKSSGDAAVSESNRSNIDYQRQLTALAGRGMNSALKALKVQSAQKASASESGIGGSTVNLSLMDTHADMLRTGTGLADQAAQLHYNNLLNADDIQSRTSNRINSVSQGTRTSFFKEFVQAGLSYATQKYAGGSPGGSKISTELPTVVPTIPTQKLNE